MSGRWLQNLALFGFAAVLGLVVFFEPGKDPVPPPTLLTELTGDGLTRIGIERPRQPSVELSKKDGNWRLLSPVAVGANGTRIESLIKVLAAHSHSHFPVIEKELGRFSLAPPKATLMLNGTALLFGDTEALNGHRYVRVGNDIHLTTDAYYHHLIATWPSFVSLRLLPAGAKLTGLRLPGLELHREAGAWQLALAPEAVSADAIEALVQAWQNAQALRVTAMVAGLKVDGVIRLKFSGQQTALEFELVKTASDLILRRPDLGIQYHLPTAAGSRLLMLPADVESP